MKKITALDDFKRLHITIDDYKYEKDYGIRKMLRFIRVVFNKNHDSIFNALSRLEKIDAIDLDDLQSALGYLYSGCELFNQQREEPAKTLQLGITLRETNKLKNLIETLREER